MKYFLTLKLWPVVAGLLTAFSIMILCEYANSLMYPLPDGLDIYNHADVKAFTASLPWTAYILVFVGWVLGSFAAGYVTTKFSKEPTYRLSLMVGIILTILGLINNIAIGHNLFFNLVGLPMFILFTYLGHAHYRKKSAV